jgi:hypothetical protein
MTTTASSHPGALSQQKQQSQSDQSALLLMLSYVEAECLRIGAAAAARHAAMAAALLPSPLLRDMSSHH